MHIPTIQIIKGVALILITTGVIISGLLIVEDSAPAQTIPDPVTCVGYPEHRIYLENQSWWEPQVGPTSHPGTGKQGHIHVGTCFPLYQSLSGNTLHLDINIKLHNIPGTPSKIRLQAYQITNWVLPGAVPACAVADCEYWYSWDVPISDTPYRGWRMFGLFLNVVGFDAVMQRNWTHYMAYMDYPLKPEQPPGSVGTVIEHPGGDTWYGNVIGGTTGKYANARIERTSVPWDESTGVLTPLSGTWSPKVMFEALKSFVYIDPALHANPPSKGTIVFEGTGDQTLSIDTTKLTDGLHKLLIGTSNVGTNGANTGVLVVPFLVDNACG